MLKFAAKRIRTGLVIGLAAALTVAGLAAAQGGGASNGRPAGRPGHQGPPPIGLPLRGLTYAELHVLHDKEEKTITVSQGKVLSVGESSITLSENNGAEVTISTSEETQVKGGPGRKVSLEELEGKLVLVCAPSGGAAKTIIVEPKHGAKGGPGGGEGPEGGPFGARRAHNGRRGAPRR